MKTGTPGPGFRCRRPKVTYSSSGVRDAVLLRKVDASFVLPLADEEISRISRVDRAFPAWGGCTAHDFPAPRRPAGILGREPERFLEMLDLLAHITGDDKAVMGDAAAAASMPPLVESEAEMEIGDRVELTHSPTVCFPIACVSTDEIYGSPDPAIDDSHYLMAGEMGRECPHRVLSAVLAGVSLSSARDERSTREDRPK